MKATFKERLKELREDLGLSQRQLGEEIGTTHVNISRWEAGKSEPTLSNLITLTSFFEVSAGYLMGIED